MSDLELVQAGHVTIMDQDSGEFEGANGGPHYVDFVNDSQVISFLNTWSMEWPGYLTLSLIDISDPDNPQLQDTENWIFNDNVYDPEESIEDTLYGVWAWGDGVLVSWDIQRWEEPYGYEQDITYIGVDGDSLSVGNSIRIQDSGNYVKFIPISPTEGWFILYQSRRMVWDSDGFIVALRVNRSGNTISQEESYVVTGLGDMVVGDETYDPFEIVHLEGTKFAYHVDAEWEEEFSRRAQIGIIDVATSEFTSVKAVLDVSESYPLWHFVGSSANSLVRVTNSRIMGRVMDPEPNPSAFYLFELHYDGSELFVVNITGIGEWTNSIWGYGNQPVRDQFVGSVGQRYLMFNSAGNLTKGRDDFLTFEFDGGANHASQRHDGVVAVGNFRRAPGEPGLSTVGFLRVLPELDSWWSSATDYDDQSYLLSDFGTYPLVKVNILETERPWSEFRFGDSADEFMVVHGETPGKLYGTPDGVVWVMERSPRVQRGHDNVYLLDYFTGDIKKSWLLPREAALFEHPANKIEVRFGILYYAYVRPEDPYHLVRQIYAYDLTEEEDLGVVLDLPEGSGGGEYIQDWTVRHEDRQIFVLLKDYFSGPPLSLPQAPPVFDCHVEWSSAIRLPAGGPANSRGGSSVLLSDGRVLHVWSQDGHVKQGHAPDMETFLSTNGSVVFDKDLMSGRGAVAPMSNGDIALTRAHLAGSVWTLDVHISSDEGETWSLLGTAQSVDMSGSSVSNIRVWTSPLVVLPSGRMVFTSTFVQFVGSNTYFGHPAAWYSDDGMSWTRGSGWPTGSVHGNRFIIPTLSLQEGRLYGGFMAGSGLWGLRYSEDDGASWSSYSWSATSGDYRDVGFYDDPDRPAGSVWGYFVGDAGHVLAFNPTPTSAANWETTESLPGGWGWTTGMRGVELVGDYWIAYSRDGHIRGGEMVCVEVSQ